MQLCGKEQRFTKPSIVIDTLAIQSRGACAARAGKRLPPLNFCAGATKIRGGHRQVIARCVSYVTVRWMASSFTSRRDRSRGSLGAASTLSRVEPIFCTSLCMQA